MFHETVKKYFKSAVDLTVSNISQFVRNPDKDFSRTRKIPPELLISFLVSQGASSTRVELLDFFDLNVSSPSVVKSQCFRGFQPRVHELLQGGACPWGSRSADKVKFRSFDDLFGEQEPKKEGEQGMVGDYVVQRQVFPSKGEAELLRVESGKGELDAEKIREILCRNKKAAGITISAKRIRDYFPEDYTKEEIEKIVYSLLDSWRANGSE